MNTQAQTKSFDTPDEKRTSENGNLSIVNLGDTTIGKAEYAPGWRWSVDVGPMVGSDTCHALHTGYVISGHLHVRMNDGTEIDARAGDAVVIPPGHDGWVVGDEPCVMIDWTGTKPAT